MTYTAASNKDGDARKASTDPSEKLGRSQKVFDHLFGYDYFLAHRSVDGKTYASALYEHLTAKGNELDCFLDVKHYGAGGGLTAMQARALKKTTRLIVIVTSHAHDSDAKYLLGEVRQFKKQHPNGIIVPIGTKTTLSKNLNAKSELLALVPNLDNESICILEDDAQWTRDEPSTETVKKLLNDFAEERRATTRLRWIRRAAGALTVLLVAAIAFGIYAVVQQSRAKKAQDSAEKALSNSFIRTIGVPFHLSTVEPEALWELAELNSENDGVRRTVLKEWFASKTLFYRATNNGARGLRAAIGINPAMKRQNELDAENLANRIVEEFENLKETGEFRSTDLGQRLAQLAACMEPAAAARVTARGARHLAKALVNSGTNPDGLVSLGNAQEELVAHMEPEAAAKIAGTLAKAMENPPEIDAERLSSWGKVLAALSARMESPEAEYVAARGALQLTKQLIDQKQTNFFALLRLEEALAALALRMEPNEVADLAEMLTEALENPHEMEGDRLATLGNALAALAARMDSVAVANVAERGAQRLADVIEHLEKLDFDRKASMGKALAILGARMESAAATSLAKMLAKVLENRAEFDEVRLASLRNALAGLATHMDPAAATSLAEMLTKLDNPQESDVDGLSSLGNALSALAARMEPAAASRVAELGAQRLAKELENSQESYDSRLPGLENALAVLAARMEPAAAANLAGILAKILENPQDSNYFCLERLGNAVPALAARMEPAAAASLAEMLTKALENTLDTDALRPSVLGTPLASFAESMNPGEAATPAEHGAERLVLTLEHSQETDPVRLSSMGTALAVLAHIVPAARKTELLGLSYLLLDSNALKRPDKGKPESYQRKTFLKGCERLGTSDLANMLKWPFCVGEAETIVLAELEKKTGKTFGVDLWKFVNLVEIDVVDGLAPSFLISPTNHPTFKEVLEELQEINAKNPAK